ncbi:MAG TPA: hypothetical protein DEF43_06930 [Chloroflexus aurantiacus]|uniref:Glycerophosphoryl diester phosphodiesterase membrane domain-containing protein n=1 Tax=Chloroflexus aurantiacus (strain ATCC 29366 / DSM 635 / J-10-fl) TaxID=324602 RepID=A9WKG3_CHLAA|nr:MULTISPECIES: hypothetical protein [Chloroflexus]ABY36591.1 hypothetical protein Caur_3406 [Chloroflexus aurantiacus J-10-fl]GIV95181.1 MAG: hypothetical protein KatS3mg056_3890 [Chloroflexus sp.]HBW66890.1 hypothetical protein [Chloroflexus aurantiacus]
MRSTLRSTLDEVMILLDAGVALYRRHLARFLVLAGLFSLPAMVATFNLLLAIDDIAEAGIEEISLLGLSLFLTSLLMIPPLTRATRIALEDEVPSLRSVLWRWPRLDRWLLATAYGGCLIPVWLMLFSTVSGILFGMCCGVIGLAAYVVVFASVMANTALGFLLLPVLIVATLIAYLLYIVFMGAGLMAALYNVQPLIDDTIPLAEAFRLSWSLLFARIGYNLLVFVCAALIFSVASLIVTIAMAVLLPAPFGLILGANHPLTRGLSAVAWVIGLAVAMPLLPIWSTLHYRWRLNRYKGRDLARQIQQAGLVEKAF